MFDPPEYIHKRNKDKHNYWFLVSFSLLSILFHLFPISRELHDILYSANVFSLIGFTVIAVFYPYRLYNYYGETFRNIIAKIGLCYSRRNDDRSFVGELCYSHRNDDRSFVGELARVVPFNVYILLTIAWIVHVLPVYLFRNTYSLGNPVSWILLYFVFAGPFLGKIYNLTFHEIAGVFIITAISTGLVCWISRESVFM
jgi:hypothetical protein